MEKIILSGGIMPAMYQPVSRVFDLSFDSNNCQLILKIRKDFFTSNKTVTLERITSYAKEFLKQNELNYQFNFDFKKQGFGFDKIFQKIHQENDGFVYFQTDKFHEPLKICATLHVFLFFAQFFYLFRREHKEVEEKMLQKIEIQTSFICGDSSGFHILGSCSPVISAKVASITDVEIKEIIKTMTNVEKKIVDEKHVYEFMFSVSPYNSIIQINAPSIKSGLWLIVGDGEICGHNIDRPDEQIILLSALAKICDFCE
ncbi:MAG TPA: hypothetical protein PLD95_03250 [bacterium]|jgi:hypothetical protein|nr:hypothetical protein [bacterium]HOG38463.1 hypothetical protein [bacterium]